jgi:gas vesicle protein
MTENASLNLSLQRANQARAAKANTGIEDDLADKLKRSIDIIEQQKRKPLQEQSAEELLALRAAINTELADRKERNQAEHARLAKELATLARAGISRPRATRRDKGIKKPRGFSTPANPPHVIDVTDPEEI